jgi:uncharacterized membrane protein YccC
VSDDTLASDAEREAAATELRGHLADGRLTTDEFGERIDAVYAARTHAALSTALERLPGRTPAEPKSPSLAPLAARLAVQSALPVVICTLVWAFTGMHGDFWPKWVILGMTIAFVSRISRAATGDREARAELERRVGGN